jgi:hypothetical protein
MVRLAIQPGSAHRRRSGDYNLCRVVQMTTFNGKYTAPIGGFRATEARPATCRHRLDVTVT